MKSVEPAYSPIENLPREAEKLPKMSNHPPATTFPFNKITQIVIIVMGSIAFAYVARPVVLPILLAWVAAMTLKPPVNWLRAGHFPATLAAAIVLGTFLVMLASGAIWLGRPAIEWSKSAPEKIPELKMKIRNVLDPVLRFSAAASNVGNLETTPNSTNAVPSVAVKDNHMAGSIFTWTGSLLAGISEAIVLTFLLLAAGEPLLQKVARLMPNRQYKKHVSEIGLEIQHSISNYLFTVGLINLGLGAAVGTALWLLKLPNAPMWGGLAAILNFLPFFGPILGMCVIGIVGLISFDTVGGALLPIGAYLGLHLMETYLVTPFALGQRFRLNLVVIFLAFMFFAWLWGIIGALLAMPVLVSLKTVFERIPILSPFAKLLSS